MGRGFGAAKKPRGCRRVNRIALGTVQFGLPYGVANRAGQVTRAEARKMLEVAGRHGIDTLDTAMAYGESEVRLGEAGIRDFNVITKLPGLPAGCVNVDDWVEEQIDASLSRLGAVALYGLLLHRADQLAGPDGVALAQALLRAKESGKVRKVGVSVYSPADLEAVANRLNLDLVQAPLNLVDRRLLTSGWLDRLHDNGVEIHARSAFLQGLLLMPRAAMPAWSLSWKPLWDKWHLWLSRHHVSAVQACLAFPLGLPQVDRVVVGADNSSQLEQILMASSSPLSIELPQLSCEAAELIDPSRWPHP
jgi:aryl-alcohol dehydrogenase-like predicted oxidoreductase